MKKNAFSAASAIMAVSLGLAGAAEAATIRVVALTGQEAPGTGGAVFSGFTGLSLNDAGEVAFRAGLSGAGVTDETDSGVFTSGALVAREGDVAPGTGGSVFASFGGSRLNNAGEVAFRTTLEGAGGDGQAIFSVGTLVARRGDAVPGGGGAVFSSFTPPVLNDAGQVVFRAGLSGPGVTAANDRALLAGGAIVARTGDEAPGTGGAVFSGLFDDDLNASGQAAFLAGLSGPGVTGDFDDNAIFIDDTLVVRDGDAVPGVAGATFRNVRSPKLNDAGELAFKGFMNGAGLTEENDAAIFASGVLVARDGDVAPGAGGAVFADLRGGTLELNNSGDTAFAALLGGAGLTEANDEALFATRGGILELILRDGDLLDIGGGELRPILSFGFGGQGGFNENGDIAFFAELGPIAGGGGPFGIGPGAVGQGLSGIFVYEADRIPPPAVVPLPPAVGLMLAGMAALGLAGRRRAAPTREG
jgi:hypothetical protein